MGCWSSSGGRAQRCARVYSTSATRLPTHRRRHRGRACCPRDLYVPPGDRSRPTGWQRPELSWGAPMVGGIRLSAVRGLAGTRNSWVRPHCWWCRSGCPQCGVRSIPAPGFRGCVVGRVAEVESIGVRGCTRPPVLDFRLTGGVSVAARATPATSMCPKVTGPAPPGGNAPGCRGWTPMVGGVWLSAMRSRARSVVRGCAPIAGAGSCCPQRGV